MLPAVFQSVMCRISFGAMYKQEKKSMDPYIPVSIWIASAVICSYIAKVRHVKPTLLWQFIVVLLGPLAIPLIFFARSNGKINAR